MKFNTIVALATAPLPSALAIIRLSGFDAFEIAEKMSDQKFVSLSEKTILLGKIIDGEKTIDQVVFLAFVGPRSFTGENIVEIVCHGSMVAIQEILALAIKYGARSAEPGEFSSRAYLNQKMDLVQAEAIHDMISSVTPEAKALAIRSLEGQTSRLLSPIKTKIADLLSLIEVNIDYPEYEDIEKVSLKKIVQDTEEMLKMLADLISFGKKGKVIQEGVTVAIVGKPNVGKSSLLNALLNEEKAIVTPVPGTTRDTVEAEINLNGILLKLLDTAGIRKNPKMIEAIGIEKSKEIIKSADLVLVVLDGSKPLTKEDETILKLTEKKRRLIVYNKADLVKKQKENTLYISALKKDISALQKAIFDTFGLSEKSFNSPSFYASRQLAKLEQIGEALKKANGDALNGMTLDLISVSLQEAYQHAINLLGLEIHRLIHRNLLSVLRREINMFLTDTHCHLNAPEFNGQIPDLIKRAKNALVERFFVVGWDEKSSEEAILLANQYPNVYAVVGLHPVEASPSHPWNEKTFKQLAIKPKVIAIGEIGLDYYWKKTEEEHIIQKNSFISQIKFANDLKLPIVVHCRDAYEDLLEILKKHPPVRGGVMHCYNGPLSMVKSFIEAGMLISIGGPLTFKNSENLREIVKTIDLNQLLIETDSPYLAPMPYRGKTNEPGNLKLIFDKITELTGEEPTRLAKILENNLTRKFHVKHG